MTEMRVAGAEPQWTLNDRLRKAREFAGLTQGDLAERTGISRRSVSAYETGGNVRRPQLVAWAMCCGVSLDWLEGRPSGPSVPPAGIEPATDRLEGGCSFR